MNHPFFGVYQNKDGTYTDLATGELINQSDIHVHRQPFYGVFYDKDGVEHELKDLSSGGSSEPVVQEVEWERFFVQSRTTTPMWELSLVAAKVSGLIYLLGYYMAYASANGNTIQNVLPEKYWPTDPFSGMMGPNMNAPGAWRPVITEFVPTITVSSTNPGNSEPITISIRRDGSVWIAGQMTQIPYQTGPRYSFQFVYA